MIWLLFNIVLEPFTRIFYGTAEVDSFSKQEGIFYTTPDSYDFCPYVEKLFFWCKKNQYFHCSQIFSFLFPPFRVGGKKEELEASRFRF